MDSDANFMRVKIARLKEAHIVGGHYRQATRFRQGDGRMQIALFVRTPGTDQLQVIAIREILFVERDALIHQRVVTAQQTFADIPHTTTGDQQQTFVQLCQPVAVNPWTQCAVAALVGF